MKVSDFSQFFRREEEEAEAVAMHKSRMVLDWVSQDYHKEFVDWLETQASRPIDISERNTDMIQAAVRANTFKEIQRHLSLLQKNAKAALTPAEE